MSRETELDRLLGSLSPRLMDGEFVFCSFEGADYGDYSNLAPVAAIREAEGLTLVVPRSKADEQAIGYTSVFKMITLSVHSSLEAVGLTAAFSSKLTEHGISSNVIAGYHHDHIFVPRDQAARAVAALEELSR